MGELIAFLSGKGGTGKTSVCAGVATALARANYKVLCIDCDVGLRNLDISLAMADRHALSFKEMYETDRPHEDAAVHPQFPNLRFLTAPVNCTADEIDIEAFGEFLRRVRKHFNFVFLDAPAGVDAGFRLAATFADRCLVVTAADPASMRDAARTADLLELMGKSDMRLIVNRVDEKLFAASRATIDDVIDRTGIPLLGIVPEDSTVALAATMEEPLINCSRKGAASACCRIAKRILGYSVPVAI